ncbi:MAG: ketoacyl-ACP synthase III [Chlamydiales bacterium]|nr:ketoacyl-ACP synthase III [Chlamydiales bacterium]
MPATITAIAAYLPEKVLSNSDLEKMVETSDEWIVTRTGIQERRIAHSEEFPSSMGAKAALSVLEKANVEALAVDAILCATMTPDHITPSTAALIQGAIGAKRACCLDIQAACSGFLYALSIAKGWIESGMYKNVLVIATEKNSAFIDYKDRNTCVLFGDGCGACLVQSEGSGYQIKHICLGADGSESDLISIPAGGSRLPASGSTHVEGQHYMKMDGKEVFKHAVRRMEASSKECLEAAGIAEADITWLIPHQANIRIIEAISKRFNIPWERTLRTIHKYGNTSSATIPIALAELDEHNAPQKGEHLLLTAFGAGLTWGSSLLTKV